MRSREVQWIPRDPQAITEHFPGALGRNCKYHSPILGYWFHCCTGYRTPVTGALCLGTTKAFHICLFHEGCLSSGVGSWPVSDNPHYSLLDSLLLAADCPGKGTQKEVESSPDCLLLMLRAALRPQNSLILFHWKGNLAPRKWFEVRRPKPWQTWMVYAVVMDASLLISLSPLLPGRSIGMT